LVKLYILRIGHQIIDALGSSNRARSPF